MPTLRVAAAAVVLALTGLATANGATPETPIASAGRLIDVGGHRLYLSCSGEGTPTVVIDAGAGTWSIHYRHIQRALEPTTRVCTFDRAGLGRSDPGPAPRTSRRMTDELHTLLHAAEVAPPLLLVGHSLGGYNARIYQASHPREVAGLVLIDAAHEQQWERLPPEARQAVEAALPAMRQQAELARGGGIAAADVDASFFSAVAPELAGEYVAAMRSPKPHEGLAAEFEAAFESAGQVPRGPLGDLPLVVLTSRRSFEAFAGSGIPIEASNEIWMTLQEELAGLSTRSVHMVSDQGDHALNRTDPDAVVSAIEQGIRMVRQRLGVGVE